MRTSLRPWASRLLFGLGLAALIGVVGVLAGEPPTATRHGGIEIPAEPPRDPPPPRSGRGDCSPPTPTSEAELAAEWKAARSLALAARKAGDRRCEARGLERLGHALAAHEDRLSARRFWSAALEAFDAARAGNDVGVLTLVQSLASAAAAAADGDAEAVGLYERALAIVDAAAMAPVGEPLCPTSGALDDDTWHLQYVHDQGLGNQRVSLHSALAWQHGRGRRPSAELAELRATLDALASTAATNCSAPAGCYVSYHEAASVALRLRSIFELASGVAVEVADFRRAAELAGGSTNAHDRLLTRRLLAESEETTGDFEAARRTLETALAADPAAERGGAPSPTGDASGDVLAESERRQMITDLVRVLALGGGVGGEGDLEEGLRRLGLTSDELATEAVTTAVTLIDRGRLGEARRFVAVVSALLPADRRGELAFWEARAREKAGDLEGAEATLRAALAAEPDAPLRARQLAGFLSEHDRDDEAEALYLETATRFPDDVELAGALARFYEARERPADAAAWQERLVAAYRAHDPGRSLAPSLVVLARLFQRAYGGAGAAPLLEQAAALYRGDGARVDRRGLAAVRIAEGRFAEARQLYAEDRREVEGSPFHDAMVELDLAKLEVEAGDSAAARAHVARVLALAAPADRSQGEWQPGALGAAAEVLRLLGLGEEADAVKGLAVARGN